MKLEKEDESEREMRRRKVVVRFNPMSETLTCVNTVKGHRA